MIGSFWNANMANLGSHYATNEWVERWLTFDYMSAQDRQGYILTSAGSTSTDWGQGWAFPDYHHNKLSPLGYEFSKGVEGWTAGADTKVSAFSQAHPDGGAFASDEGVERYLLAETEGESETLEILSPELGADAFLSPFLFLSWELECESGLENIEDMVVSFQTDKKSEWSEMSFSEYATRFSPFAETEGSFQATFVPMYLHPDWGRTYGGTEITRLRLTLKAKPGKTFQGKILYNFIRGDFDDRLPDNNGEYIIAAKNYLSYAQDKELLEEVLPYARRAMQFYLTVLDGEKEGVVSTQELVGHFCAGVAATGVGIGNGFWDAISFPKVNFYTNITYYRALEAMAYLEEMAASMGVESAPVSILGKDMKTVVPYAETVETLKAKLETCRSKMRTLFWDNEKGRFFAGYYDADGDGVADGDSEGPVGIDCEFLEAALLFVSVPDAFFGLSPLSDGTLAVEPYMPSSLNFWRMENLAFAGKTYDCSIGRYFVQISNVSGEGDANLEIRLRKPDFRYKVTCNGSPVDSTEENGRIVVKVPFGNVKVEVSKA